MSELLLVTGKKGSGKTLWVVDQLFKEFEKNPEREYFSDVTNLRHTGVKPAPDDWTTIPNNSLIVYDEVQFKLLFSRHNSKRDTQILSLTTMRKRGIAIWLITQKARFLNADVLGLVDRHIEIRRNGKLTSKVYEFQDAELNITKTKMMFAFDKYVFAHPKELWGFYDSIEPDAKHVDKSYINKGVVSTAITLALVFIFGGYYLYNTVSNDGLVLNKEQKAADTKSKANSATQAAPGANQDIQNKIDLCMKSFNWTADQCKQAYDVKSENKRVEELQQATGNNMDTVVLNYNPSKPFDTQYTANVTPTDFPKFAGCLKKGNVYVAYTQQGTILKDVSQSDCRRVVEDGDRPFDYFKQPVQVQNNAELPPKADNTQSSQPDVLEMAKMEQAKLQGLI